MVHIYMQANTHPNRIKINKSPLKAKLKFICIIFYYVYGHVPMNAEPLEARTWDLLERELHIVMRYLAMGTPVSKSLSQLSNPWAMFELCSLAES